MRVPLANLKSALVTGLLVVLPAWLALLLFKLLVKLGVLVKPIPIKACPPPKKNRILCNNRLNSSKTPLSSSFHSSLPAL